VSSHFLTLEEEGIGLRVLRM